MRWHATTCSTHQLNTTAAFVQVVDHYDNPRNVGSFNKTDADVGTGLVGAPACGDVMKLQLRVRRAGSIPLAAVLEGYSALPVQYQLDRGIE